MPTIFSVISARNVVKVHTPSYALRADKRDEEWHVRLMGHGVSHQMPLCTSSGLWVGPRWRPFEDAYLVSADARGFEVRLDARAETPQYARCVFSGDAEGHALTLALHAGSPEGSAALSMVWLLNRHVAGEHEGRYVWPGGRAEIEAVRAYYACAEHTFVVRGVPAAPRKATGVLPAREHVAAELRVIIRTSGDAMPRGQEG